jgi:hypothetical protein
MGSVCHRVSAEIERLFIKGIEKNIYILVVGAYAQYILKDTC